MDEAGEGVPGAEARVQGTDEAAGRLTRWLRVLADAVCGAGAGLLVLAAWVAAFAMLFGTPNDPRRLESGVRGARFSDIETPIGGLVVGTASVLVALLVLVWIRVWGDVGRRVASQVSVVLAVGGSVALIVIAEFTRMLDGRDPDGATSLSGTGYSGIVASWWLTLVGCVLVVVSCWFTSRTRWIGPVAALLTIAIGAAMLGVPPVEGRDDLEVSIEYISDKRTGELELIDGSLATPRRVAGGVLRPPGSGSDTIDTPRQGLWLEGRQ